MRPSSWPGTTRSPTRTASLATRPAAAAVFINCPFAAPPGPDFSGYLIGSDTYVLYPEPVARQCAAYRLRLAAGDVERQFEFVRYFVNCYDWDLIVWRMPVTGEDAARSWVAAIRPLLGGAAATRLEVRRLPAGGAGVPPQ